ncbi:hypothetical protein BV898_19980, partial [Hypsibius exemplaris]
MSSVVTSRSNNTAKKRVGVPVTNITRSTSAKCRQSGPRMLYYPQNQTVTAGRDVSFTCGTGWLSEMVGACRWIWSFEPTFTDSHNQTAKCKLKHPSSNWGKCTSNSTLTISNVTALCSGRYRCKVSPSYDCPSDGTSAYLAVTQAEEPLREVFGVLRDSSPMIETTQLLASLAGGVLLFCLCLVWAGCRRTTKRKSHYGPCPSNVLESSFNDN